jgi:tetratricopeptide (TPR) repeat protein
LESAKENLKNHCLFGLSTQFDEFLFRLSRLMGLEINGYIKKNITYKKKQRQEHDPQLIKKIAELNALDVEFYQYAENLYQQQMARRSAGELADCTVFIEKMCSMNQISVEYHEANKYYDNQQWPEAKKRFKELIDRYNNIPQSLKAEICFKLGNCSKEMGTADADTWFAQCMDLYLPHLGSGPLTDYRVGSVHKRLKEFNTAARYFSNVVNHPDMTDILAKGGAYFHLGDIAMRQTNHKQAIEYFKKALELNPDHLKAAQYIQDLTEKQ